MPPHFPHVVGSRVPSTVSVAYVWRCGGEGAHARLEARLGVGLVLLYAHVHDANATAGPS
eukprot:scaffold1206_cov124-Isochrysis_galbana.AAC.1